MATSKTTRTTTTGDAPKRRAPRRRSVAHEDIAARAYAIFETEGGGDHVAHWLRAEQELHAPARRRR
jgi:hypothetical protein